MTDRSQQPKGPTFCAIDFGTSNSAVALPAPAGQTHLVELEPGFVTMPTAVFYRADGPAWEEPAREYGRAAVAAYVDGLDGRLMRSMKSILGSPLAQQTTDVGGGRGVRYVDIVSGYLRELLARAQRQAGHPIERAVLGRPVFFVDDDPARDAQAQAALEAAARAAGLREVQFQFEPIAAALDHERTLEREELVLVADIGGGTSDFSLVRVGPERRQRADRRADILANHGVHVAGTDFDRHIELAAIMPLLGFRAFGPPRAGEPAREVPSGIYFDLSTWHLINSAYAPARLAELRQMRGFYAEPRHHARLMTTLEERLGHALAGAAEQAKIDAATQGQARIELSLLEPGLACALSEREAAGVIEADCARIEQAAGEAVRLAGVAPQAVDALYFTGGSTGLAPLVARIAGCFPQARRAQGDRFASVARGLGEHARLVFSD